MRVAVTGASGFLGRYLVRALVAQGHDCRAWFRPSSDRGGLEELAGQLVWVPGDLADPDSAATLVAGCQAVVHAALDRPGRGFRRAEGSVVQFVERNVVGTLRLIEAARAAGAGRFVFLSTCAVHEVVLDDRPLDEAHPTWSNHHYGAHKAAIEQFVRSYGWGEGYEICALRPTGIYGLAHPPQASKWYDLVAAVVRGQPVACRGGGKEVHAADVARAVCRLLTVPDIAGQVFNCYDRYVSEWDVAHLAREITGSSSEIAGGQLRPRHEIETGKLRGLGLEFGGQRLLEETVQQLVAAIQGGRAGA